MKTPVMPRGSGTFHRDQTCHSIRQEMETMRECPACIGGVIRTIEETATQYKVWEDKCGVCDGLGMVPKHKVA